MKNSLESSIAFIIKCARVTGIFYALKIFVNDNSVTVIQICFSAVFRKI